MLKGPRIGERNSTKNLKTTTTYSAKICTSGWRDPEKVGNAEDGLTEDIINKLNHQTVIEHQQQTLQLENTMGTRLRLMNRQNFPLPGERLRLYEEDHRREQVPLSGRMQIKYDDSFLSEMHKFPPIQRNYY